MWEVSEVGIERGCRSWGVGRERESERKDNERVRWVWDVWEYIERYAYKKRRRNRGMDRSIDMILWSSMFHAYSSLKLEEEQKAKEREDQERERLFLQEQEQREIRDEQITKLRY